MPYDSNPFSPEDRDRYQIWEKVVQIDIDAFLAEDWSMCQEDFWERDFMGIHAHHSDNPDNWRLHYPTLDVYRDDWLQQAKAFADGSYAEDKREALFRATSLEKIEIEGDSALLHKKFNGSITKADGTLLPIVWQTLYRMRKIDGAWKITGFVGYLPNPMGSTKDTYAADR